MQMKGTLSLSTHALVAAILLYKAKHRHLLYCSTLIPFLKKLGKFSSIPLKVSSYDPQLILGEIFCPLSFAPQILSFMFRNTLLPILLCQIKKILQICLLETFLENKKSKCLHFTQHIHTL